MATAAPSSSRNKVLSVTMQAIDKMTPGIKAMTTMLQTFRRTAIVEVKAALAPFRDAGKMIFDAVRPTHLFQQALQALLSPIRLVGEGLNKLMTLPGRLMRAMMHPFRTLHSLLTSLLSPLNLVMGAVTFLAARGVFRFFSQAADDLDVIDDLNRRLSVSIHALQQYRLVAELQGTTLEQLVQSWQQMTNAIGEATQGQGRAVAALRELGLSAHQLRRLAPEKQFEAIRDALSDITNETDRMRLAMDIFGRRRGAELQRILKITREEFQQLRDEAFLFDYEDLQRVSEFKDSITLIRRTWQDVKTIVAVQFMPLLRDGINRIREFLRDSMPNIREGARDVARHVEFISKTAIESIGLIRRLLVSDTEENASALGELLRISAGLAIDIAQDTITAIVQMIISAAGALIIPLGNAALEMGKVIGSKIIEGLQPQLTGFFQGLVNNPIVEHLTAVITGQSLEFVRRANAEMQRLEQQMLDNRITTTKKEMMEKFGRIAQDAAREFRFRWDDTIGEATHWYDQMGRSVDFFVSQLNALAQENPEIAAFVDRIRELRDAIYGASDAMLGLKNSPPEPDHESVSAWKEFFNGFIEAARTSILAMEQVGHRVFQIFDSSINSMIDSAWEGTFKITNAFRQMGIEVGKILTKLLSQQMALGILRRFFPDDILGDSFGMYQLTPNAKGNIFHHGNIVPFARGGVVDQPVLFPMRRGAGLMGEAGPEAILPLARDNQGRLGVRAMADQSHSTTVNVTFQINAIDTHDADRLIVERRKLIEDIMVRAVQTRTSVRQSIREVR